MPGMINRVVIGDADSLVALASKDDANHDKARKIAAKLLEENYQVMYPNTAILEAVTALKRKLNLADRAELIARQYIQGAFTVVWVDEEIQRKAMGLYVEEAVSKKNTIFDCIVAICTKHQSAEGVFSFDEWYKKLGLSLTSELV